EREAETITAVVFRLADEYYALDARVVLEVHVLRDLTPLAGARAPLFGVTHWRGGVLTILDLRDQLGVRSGGLSDLSRVIGVDGGRHAFGILADAASDIIEVDEQLIRTVGEDVERRLVRGLTPEAIMVMDTDAILAAGREATQRDDHSG